MISVSFVDQFAAASPPKPPADHDVRPARSDRAFDRSLKDASAPKAPPAPEAKKSDPKPDRGKDDGDDATDAVATAAAASAADAKTQTDAATSTDAAASSTADSASAQAPAEPTDAEAPATNTDAPLATTPTSVQPQPATALAAPVVTDVLVAVQTPQTTSDAPATTEPEQPVTTPDSEQANVVQATQAGEQTRPSQNVAAPVVAVPVQPASGAARTDAAATNADDADDARPDSTQPHPPAAERDATRLPLPGGNQTDDSLLRDAATRQQVRQHPHAETNAQRAETVEAKMTPPAPATAQTSGGPTSPAAELARALFPEARLGDLPAPAIVSSDASHAANAVHATTSASTDAPAPTPASPTIHGATVIDAHDSGAGFRLDGAGQSAAATPVDRLTDVLASSVTPRSSFIRLQLEPPDLGQLRIEVRMNHDALTLRVQAETAAVKGLIEERMGELKSAMQQHGIRVDRVDVDVRPQPGSSNARGDGDARDAGARQHAATWDAPGNAGDWRESPDDAHESYGDATSPADEAGGPSAGGEVHFVTTESSVDVLI